MLGRLVCLVVYLSKAFVRVTIMYSRLCLIVSFSAKAKVCGSRWLLSIRTNILVDEQVRR